MRTLFVLTGAAVALSSCIAATPPLYDGPGSFQDFADARYQCLQETQTRTTSAFIIDCRRTQQFGRADVLCIQCLPSIQRLLSI